jgi:hypothetical protein
MSDISTSLHDKSQSDEENELYEEENNLQQLQSEEEQNEIEEVYENIKNSASNLKINNRSKSILYNSSEESKFPIPKNILINRKLHTKSSSYYRKNDERLESDSESELLTQSITSRSFNKSKEEEYTRIKPKQEINDPIFEIRPLDRLVRLGETVKFLCKVSGTKPLEVFWYKLNGDELTNNEKYEIYHDDECHYLKIFNTTQRDSGMYLCVISNDKEQNIDSFCLQLRGKKFIFLLLVITVLSANN